MKNQWIIINGKRYNLGAMTDLDIGDPDWGTGIKLKGVYLMPKSKKVIVHTYSIWENPRTHGCYGDRYHIASQEEVANLADIFGDERLLELVPQGE